VLKDHEGLCWVAVAEECLCLTSLYDEQVVVMSWILCLSDSKHMVEKWECLAWSVSFCVDTCEAVLDVDPKIAVRGQ